MAVWIELHQTLPGHKKLGWLAEALHVERMQAMGHLTTLWLWAIDQAEDGDLTDFTVADIAEAARWKKKPQTFVAALEHARFIDVSDGRRVLHDWMDYAGTLMARREKDRDRKRTVRALSRGQSNGQGVDCPRDVRSNRTLPDRTAPNPRRVRDGEQQPRAHEAAASEQAEEPVIYRLHREHFGSPNGKIDELARYEETPAAVLEMAFAEAASGGGRSWWYVKSILERWEAAGILDDPRAVELDRLQQEVG